MHIDDVTASICRDPLDRWLGQPRSFFFPESSRPNDFRCERLNGLKVGQKNPTV